MGDLHQKDPDRRARAGRPDDEPHRPDRLALRGDAAGQGIQNGTDRRDASADIDLLKKIQGHTAAIQTLTIEMIEARKKANRIENARAKAIAYHDTVEVYFEEIRRHIDKLEEIIDDQMWTLPKYRELLFIR